MFKIRTQAIVFGCVLPGHRSPIRMNVLPDKQLGEGWSSLREQRCLCRRKRQLKEELWWPVLTNILRLLLGSWSSGENLWLQDCYDNCHWCTIMFHCSVPTGTLQQMTWTRLRSVSRWNMMRFPPLTQNDQVACSWEECKAAHLRACEAYANSGRSGVEHWARRICWPKVSI